MKANLLLLLFALVSLNLYAQSSCIPNYIHVSGVARYTNGFPVADSVIDIKVELSQGDMNNGGTLKYCEQVQDIPTNSFGEFSLDFGNPTLICNPPAVLMSAVDWTTCNMWYRLSWRMTGNPYVQIASNSFSTVPYAFAARNAEKVKGINVTGATSGQILKYNGTEFVPSNAYTAGTGINITGTTIKQDIPNASVRCSTQMALQYSSATWINHSCVSVNVPVTGKYLVNAGAFGSKNASGFINFRIIDQTTNTVICAGVAAGVSGANLQAMGAVSNISSLTQGHVLIMQVACNDSNGTCSNGWWAGAYDSDAQAYLNIVRLSD
jgi:hypothetical protein